MAILRNCIGVLNTHWEAKLKSAGEERWLHAQESEAKWWAQGEFAMKHFSREYWAWVLGNDELGTDFWEDQKVLEIGCGPKGPIYYFPEAKQRIGVEPLADYYRSMNLLADPEMELLTGIGEKLTLPDNSMTRIIIFNVLDHAQSPLQCLQEAYRVAEPGATLYLASNVFPKWLTRIQWLLTLIDHPHPHHFVPKDLVDLVKSAGWNITKTGPSQVEQSLSIRDRFRPLGMKKTVAHLVKKWFHIIATK
ncbi:MAG: Ubiquinone/menaquinone biosynthesis C-methylase UbiE [Chloroflexi bacterium]|jgi:SAM-dependent methyltransferase|nr:MAG: Ubiquinone/menaquinone biosynthesis C-methylase UbiE [Chloroflexota bacterium]